MQCERVISFIDGFNVYHAIDRLRRPEFKWLNLISLSQVFLKSNSENLREVLYFSAQARHRSELTQQRQKIYLKALGVLGVRPVLGQFKRKNRKCPSCHHKWIGHEEKETDVNLALFLLDLAYQDEFDRAIVISNDSDLAPAIQMTLKRFPNKRITTIAPPQSIHSNELIKVSSDKSKIRIEHLERCLLPKVLSDSSGEISILRPIEYTPKVYSMS